MGSTSRFFLTATMRGAIFTLVLIPVIGLGKNAWTQPHGRQTPVPVAPFLDDALPHRTPLSPGGSTWDVTDAFPSLLLPDTLVIVPNPAESDPAADRLYVGSRDGVVVSFPNDPSAASADPFLDLSDRVAVVWDGGFLGLAFHPDFGVPGSPNEKAFFAYYSSHCDLDAALEQVDLGACDDSYPRSGTDGFFQTYLRLSRFEVVDAQAAVLVGDLASEQPLINIRLYNSTHRGGGLVFGTDGYLYLTIGDQAFFDSAQRIDDNFQGGTMRMAVDVLVQPDQSWSCPSGSHLARRQIQTVTPYSDEMTGRRYCIPDDNPWLDPAGLVFEEYYSIGHRNPHRLASDPVTSRLWSGEVGAFTREEINVIQRGGNYGWPFREGFTTGLNPPPQIILGTLTDPVIDFVRAEANAIIGGYVYRGNTFPELAGQFIAGDYVTRNIWAITLDESTMTATKTLLTSFSPGSLATFGQDNQGEVFMGSVFGNHPLQKLQRISTPPQDAPAWLSQTGAFTNLLTLQPASFFVPFEPVTFWSDGATKLRWIALPNDGTHDQPDEQILFSALDNWVFPVGTVLMKHMDLPVDETDPSVTARVETRLLVHGDDGEWYGLTYRWLPDGSDAQLVAPGGTTADFTITQAGGGTVQRTWTYPGRSQCRSCHTVGDGAPLGPRTHGLNRDLTYPFSGVADNQLRTMNHLGMFSPALLETDIPNYLSAPNLWEIEQPLETRARSWLDANCAQCHRPETGNRAAFDARFTTPLSSQGLVWGSVMDDLGIPGSHLVTPADPWASIVYQRAAALGPLAMPPLLKDIVDDPATVVLWEWMSRVDPAFPRSGVAYEYYEIGGLSVLPDFDALTPVDTGVLSGFDVSGASQLDDFAFRFTAILEVPTSGDWTFFTSSDDGSQLSIDGSLVVDNDGLHGIQEASGVVTGLSAGFHEIVVTFFEGAGGQALDVSWAGPGIAKQGIAAGNLFLDTPTPIVNAPPTVLPIANQTGVEDWDAAVLVTTNDPDGDSLYTEVAGLPPGLSWDENAGAVSGRLDPDSEGTYDVTVAVSDGPESDAAHFQWTVRKSRCSNGIDDDLDGRVDWDGGGVGLPDAECAGSSRADRERPAPACGLGPELLVLLPGLSALRNRVGRRGRSRHS